MVRDELQRFYYFRKYFLTLRKSHSINIRLDNISLQIFKILNMNAEFTLKLDKKVIEQAEKYASSRKKKLSEIIEAYLIFLAQLEGLNVDSEIEIFPFVESMSIGISIPADFDFKSEYLNHLIENSNLIEKIEKGTRQSENGDVISESEMENEIKRWFE